MLISIKLSETTVTEGFVWLIAPDKLRSLPVGIRYAIMSTDAGYFDGDYAIVTDTLESLFKYGAKNSDNKYPNDMPIYEYGNNLDWITVTEEPVVDPFPEATDEQVFASMQARGLVRREAAI